jgi:hypothetical protein
MDAPAAASGRSRCRAARRYGTRSHSGLPSASKQGRRSDGRVTEAEPQSTGRHPEYCEEPTAIVGADPSYEIRERISNSAPPDDADILNVDFTYVDPEVLDAPWHQAYQFRRDRTWDIIEYVCAENDRHPVNEGGQTGAVLQ